MENIYCIHISCSIFRFRINQKYVRISKLSLTWKVKLMGDRCKTTELNWRMLLELMLHGNSTAEYLYYTIYYATCEIINLLAAFFQLYGVSSFSTHFELNKGTCCLIEISKISCLLLSTVCTSFSLTFHCLYYVNTLKYIS